VENTHIITRLRRVRVEAEREREMRQPLQENDSYITFTCMTQIGNDR
jgi:hypothetical protein